MGQPDQAAVPAGGLGRPESNQHGKPGSQVEEQVDQEGVQGIQDPLQVRISRLLPVERIPERLDRLVGRMDGRERGRPVSYCGIHGAPRDNRSPDGNGVFLFSSSNVLLR